MPCYDPAGKNRRSRFALKPVYLFLFFLALCLASLAAAQAQIAETILHTFNSYADGANPYSSLIQGSDGAYYGTTYQGGTNSLGTVFKLTAGGLTTLHSFTGPEGAGPIAALLQGSDGALYGATYFGGDGNDGAVFKLQTDGSGFTVLHSFHATDGFSPSGNLLQAGNGVLYGVTLYGGSGNGGTVFALDPDGTGFRTLYAFSASSGGHYPTGQLALSSAGKLYGVTYAGGLDGHGTVFALSTSGKTFSTLHNFNGNAGGGNPNGGLLLGSDGKLYGTTINGGRYSAGTVFSLETNGGYYTILHSFNGPDGANPYAGLFQASGGALYGTCYNGGANSYGTVFALNPDGSGFAVLHSFNGGSDGANPDGGLVLGSDGLLHGTTYYGPLSGRNLGTVFTIDSTGASFSTVFAFDDGFTDGSQAGYGSLALGKDGSYYGTTETGGDFNSGTLYKVTPAGQVTILHHFGSSLRDGTTPVNGVAFGGHGILYGATLTGGTYNGGTVYAYMPSTDTFTTLYSFGGPSGMDLAGGVLQVGSFLYGTAIDGGQDNLGVVYKIDLAASTPAVAFQVLHSFSGSDGSDPECTLLLGPGKNLYGTTNFGGAYGYGTVFKMTPGTGAITVLHSFDNTDGAYPIAGLIEGRDGLLYGVTQFGGANNFGTVFQVSADGSIFHTLASFSDSDGAYPTGVLLQASDGRLYGTTSNGGAGGNGAVFRIDASGANFTLLYSFGSPGTDGVTPQAGLVEGPDGNLYGTTAQGGIDPGYNTNIGGTVFGLLTALPIVASFSPTSGSASAGTIVSIQGGNLGSATAVTIAAVSQTILHRASDAIKIKLAAKTPTGSYPIVVTTPNGAATSARKFTVMP
ncbi:MAG TPA: choice-of-anchor tandem repeat GloVer-containing protein [Chthonomonadaceae bacterium]|nr:choice-of-anchor tandem repeat GloVer-containing protein [Chthonomonadaceae bacterium]